MRTYWLRIYGRRLMKGIVLCGGSGSRLQPATTIVNKHLLLVYNKPLVFYPIQTLVSAGITDIMVVLGGNNTDRFIPVLKNGKELGCTRLSYAYQEGAGGIAAALALAEDFADGDDICVILGDNTTDADISKDVAEFKSGAKVFLKTVHDPHRFGCPKFDKNNEISKIIEKPEMGKEPSNFAVTGLYMYDNNVFKIIKTLKPSARGELEITDVNNTYIKNNELQWSELKGEWVDSGTFDSLLKAANYWAGKNG